MSFTPNIPLATQSLGQTRQSIVDNMAILRSTIAVDHVDVNASPNGYHTVVHFENQSGNPATVAGVAELFTKTNNGTEQLFLKNGLGNVQQLTTYVSTASNARFGTNTNYQASGGGNASITGGWTYLPGGLVVNYGRATTLNPGGSITVKFAVTFPTQFISVVCTPRTTSSIGGGNHDWDVSSPGTSGFDLVINGNYNASDTFYFWAIGS